MDYAAIAAQFGGKVKPETDYASMAAQFGGKPTSPMQDMEKIQQGEGFLEKAARGDYLKAGAEFAGGMIKSVLGAPIQMTKALGAEYAGLTGQEDVRTELMKPTTLPVFGDIKQPSAAPNDVAKGAMTSGEMALEALDLFLTAGAPGAGKVSEEGYKTVEPLIPEINTIKSIPGKIKAGFETLTTAKETSKELVGKITQAEPTELGRATRGLKAIDTTNVETFNDLAKTARKTVKDNSLKVDQELAKDTVPRKVQQLALPVQAGETTIAHNYVLDALKQLKDFYTKTNDVANLGRMAEIEAKLHPKKGVGLTLKEVNGLAREHGDVLNAYNASGELASGLTKQAAENTRAGLKETVRSAMPDDVTRALDKETSDVILVRDLADDMVRKVQMLENKFQKAGLLQKAAQIAGTGFDILTGGLAKGLFKGLTGLGAKEGQSLTSIELQSMLRKNIERLNRLNALDAKAAKEAIDLLPKGKAPGPTKKPK